MPPPRPYTLVAELSYQCPLHCPYCSNPVDIGGDALPRRARDRALDRASSTRRGALGVLQLALTGGEPMLRRDLDELVAAGARGRPVLDARDRGHAFTRERAEQLKAAGLDHVQVSIQSPDPEENDRIARHPVVREEDRGRARGARARLPAHDQLRPAPPEPRPDRGDPRAHRGARRPAARAREHAVLRVGGRQPARADPDAGAARARRGGGPALPRARRPEDHRPLGAARLSTRTCRSRAWAAGGGRRW